MENRTIDQLQQIPAEKFQFVQQDQRISDAKLETKRIGYFGDVWRRISAAISALSPAMLYTVALTTNRIRARKRQNPTAAAAAFFVRSILLSSSFIM